MSWFGDHPMARNVLIAFATLGTTFAIKQCSNRSPSSAVAAPDREVAKLHPDPGDTVVIASPSGKAIPGAISSEAFEAMQKTFLAGDEEGWQELIQRGEILAIESGTPARYLDLEMLGPRVVRLLDGTHAKAKVWVSPDFVHQSRIAASTPAETSPSSSADYLKDDPASSEAKAFLLQHWGALMRTCPGLVDYASDLHWNQVTDQRSEYVDDGVRGVGIQLRVSDHPKVIPKRFIAQGHTCEFRILMDGKRLIIPKPTCASVCLETEVASNGADHIFALKQ